MISAEIFGVCFSAKSPDSLYFTEKSVVVAENDYDFKPYVFVSYPGPVILTLARLISGIDSPDGRDDFLSAASKSSCVTLTVYPSELIGAPTGKTVDAHQRYALYLKKFSLIQKLHSYGDGGYNKLDMSLYPTREEKAAALSVFPDVFPSLPSDILVRKLPHPGGVSIDELRLDENGNFVKFTEWPSASEAARHYGCHRSAISRCCLGYAKSYGGRYFRYTDATQSRRAKRLAKEPNNKKK